MSLRDNSTFLEELLALIPTPVEQADPEVTIMGNGLVVVTSEQEAGLVSAGKKTTVAQVEMPEPGSKVVYGTVTGSGSRISISPGFPVRCFFFYRPSSAVYAEFVDGTGYYHASNANMPITKEDNANGSTFTITGVSINNITMRYVAIS